MTEGESRFVAEADGEKKRHLFTDEDMDRFCDAIVELVDHPRGAYILVTEETKPLLERLA